MNENDHQLMHRCRAGDLSAFDSLVNRWRAPLARILGRLLATGSFTAWATDVDDLSQEVFLRVFQSKQNYTEAATFSTWLYRIAVNVTRDAARRKRTRDKTVDQLQPPAAPAGPEEAVCRDELQQQVGQVLAGLPANLREPLVLRHFGGLTLAETADVLGLPVGTVRSRVGTALVQLRSELHQRGITEKDLPL